MINPALFISEYAKEGGGYTFRAQYYILYIAPLASHTGNEAVVQSLLSKHANVNERDIGGWTPFHAATEAGHC